MKVAVVGMGYVGIPEAILLAEVPWIEKVYGIQRRSETSGHKIDLLNSGELPFEEPDLKEILLRVRNKFECTDNFGELSKCSVVIVAVQTPIKENLTPDLSHLNDAINNIGKNIKSRYNPLIIIVSTIPPGTTDKIKKILDTFGKRYKLVHAPERVMPKQLLENIRKYPRVIGGYDKKSIKQTKQLYTAIGVCKYTWPQFIEMKPVEAEITKTAENGIRAVQIAMANQIAIMCESAGANFYKVKEGIDSLKGDGITRALLSPGAGVGGHCLTKDGHLLSIIMPNQEQTLFNISIRINNTMPHHLWKLTEDAMSYAGISPKGAKITLFGWSYLKNSSDTRNSPAIAYKDIAEKMGCNVYVYDPVCGMGNSFRKACGADVFVIVTDHDEFQSIFATLYKLKPKSGKPLIIVDGRNAIDPKKYIEKGWVYRGVGRGDVM